jgi:hypothetical protein
MLRARPDKKEAGLVGVYRQKHTSVLTSATSERRENQEFMRNRCSRDLRVVPSRVGASSVIGT